MTRFLLGLIVGAAAFAIGERFIHPADETRDVRQPALTDAGYEERRIDTPPETSGPALSAVTPDTRRRAPEQANRVSATSGGDAAAAVQTGSAEDEECACSHGWLDRKMKRQQAARDAEPKDGQWAYSMEQLLQQFAAIHRQGSKFEIASVDCRTTFCEVKAITHAEDGWEAFQQVMHEAQQEPWSDFGGDTAAGVTSADDGPMRLEFTLKRR